MNIAWEFDIRGSIKSQAPLNLDSGLPALVRWCDFIRTLACQSRIAFALSVPAPRRSLFADWCANDSHGASGSTSDRLRDAAKQEVVEASLPMRADRYEIGMPFGCSCENGLCYVSN
jgi:hypothetical protein